MELPDLAKLREGLTLVVHEIPVGQSLTQHAALMANKANGEKLRVVAVLNGVTLFVDPGMTSKDVIKQWNDAMAERERNLAASNQKLANARYDLAYANGYQACWVALGQFLATERTEKEAAELAAIKIGVDRRRENAMKIIREAGKPHVEI